MGVTLTRSQNDNLSRVDINATTLWFSFETIVAYRTPLTEGKVVCENVWGTTTGRHLNEIDGGKPEAQRRRVPYQQFTEGLVDALSEVRL